MMRVNSHKSAHMLKTITIDDQSPYLEKVISLGEKNKRALGFFPYGAFVEQARRKKIIVAIIENKLAGYTIYNINQRAMVVYIVHLCIDSHYRERGIAKALIDKITSLTRNFNGIRVRCRRDYRASSFWPKVGFCAIDEIPGKSIKGSTLTVWWLDYCQPSIFQYADDLRLKSKTKVVIDANIFFGFNKEHPINEEIHGLLANWIEENYELCLTQEIYNEINRHSDKKTRKAARKNVESYYIVKTRQDIFHET